MTGSVRSVLLTEPIDQSGLDLLDGRTDITWRVAPDFETTTLQTEILDANAVIVRIAHLPRELLALAANLEIVSKHGVGCDNIAVDFLSENGLPMAIAAGANAQSVAEHTMALMLSAARHQRQQDREMRAGNFNARHKLIAKDLCGARGLVIGFGRIGKKVAPLMQAFGMAVTVADIAMDTAYADQLGVDTVTDFRDAMGDADFVTLHIPLNNANARLFDREVFERFKTGSVFVNCARGGIVDEDALCWALSDGPLAALGTDVFTTEPVPAIHPLFQYDNVIVTPHSGAASFNSAKAMATMSVQNVLDHFDGKLNQNNVFNQELLNR